MLGFFLILYTGRSIISDTVEILKNVDIRILIILPLLQFVSYIFIAGYYRSALRIFGHEISHLRAYGTVVSIYFVEQILPSGGLSGMSYIAYALRTVASIGLTTIIQISKYLFNYAAYVLIIPVGLVLLIRDQEAEPAALWLGVALFVGLTLALTLAGYLFSSQNHIDRFVKLVSKFVNNIARKFFKKKQLIKAGALSRDLKEFHNGAKGLLNSRSQMIKPFLFMVAAATIQLTTVYLAYVAVGETLNPGIVIMAFTFANVVGALSVVPGDVGVHETAMILVLSAVGVDPAVAISGTLLYRVFNKLIVLPVGFVVYTRYLKPAN